jgi:hypothetical protein
LLWCVNQSCKGFGVMLDSSTLKPKFPESPSTRS